MDELALVTGGAGFIGSHLVEELVRRGQPVRVFDDFSTGQRSNLSHLELAPEVVQGSLTDPFAVARAMRGVGVIYHLGALASVARSVENPAATHAACATGTLNLLDAARKSGVRRVVYAASSSAYGGAAFGVPLLDRLYDFHSFEVIPRLGALTAGAAQPYEYLVESIRKFPDQETFLNMVRNAGFERASYRNLTGGVAAMHSGWKI